MPRGISAAFLILGLAIAVRAAAEEGVFRVSKAEVRKQVVAVIEEQLAAFRAGDVAKAYGYSAGGMRSQTSLRRFAAIVQENYGEIWKSTRAEYGLVRDDGTHATVVVQVFSADGEAGYDYVLLKEKNGWRIGSVKRHEATRRNNV